jgi:hypothetical protein
VRSLSANRGNFYFGPSDLERQKATAEFLEMLADLVEQQTTQEGIRDMHLYFTNTPWTPSLSRMPV